MEIQIGTEPSAIAAVVKLKTFIQDETVLPLGHNKIHRATRLGNVAESIEFLAPYGE